MARLLALTSLSAPLAGVMLCIAVAHAQPSGPGRVVHQQTTRHYDPHLPGAAAHAPGPKPLVIALHGISDSEDWRRPIAWLRGWWSMDAVAEREGFAVVYPAAI